MDDMRSMDQVRQKAMQCVDVLMNLKPLFVQSHNPDALNITVATTLEKCVGKCNEELERSSALTLQLARKGY